MAKVLSALSKIIVSSTKRHLLPSEHLLTTLHNTPFDTRELLEYITQLNIPQKHSQQLQTNSLFSVNRKQAAELCRPLIKSVDRVFFHAYSLQESSFRPTPNLITLELLL